ncbi:MAG: hypothetical protein LBH16_04275 [Treponema sp.]|jgi:hypothetical protein|nr:hypothetical protein [Treponema sp.]
MAHARRLYYRIREKVFALHEYLQTELSFSVGKAPTRKNRKAVFYGMEAAAR